GELPRADWIDALTPDNPVFVFRLDGHMALANSLAMRIAGVTAETSDPAGGEIVRDADGTPTGVFKDNAMNLIAAAMPPPADEEIDAAFLAAQDVALSHGVTKVHDMGDGDGKSLPDFRRQKEAGRMRIRVYALSPLADWPTLAAYVEENGRGDDQFRWDGLKGFVDGSLGSATAWFYDPFTDRPDYSGMPVADLDELKADIEGADAAGLHVAVHAIGDRANDWLLDAYESAAGANGEEIKSRRFRIEHAQHLTTGEIDRFAHLGVIASMQPYHAIDDGRWAETKIGPERIKTTYAFRSLIDAGAVLTFGSDWSVAPLDPLAGIYAAVTRRTIDGANPGGWVPAQKITVDEALHAYTAANAYAGFQEDNLGTIEPGKLADLVVLADDVTQIDPTLIADVKVLRTIVGGKEEYRAEE
ncbi:MAG TPA: amidohydrolase, partial [Amphiplicatus sp.]|nr:amidohydrolase [Amphiplicatus sp.]